MLSQNIWDTHLAIHLHMAKNSQTKANSCLYKRSQFEVGCRAFSFPNTKSHLTAKQHSHVFPPGPSETHCDTCKGGNTRETQGIGHSTSTKDTEGDTGRGEHLIYTLADNSSSSPQYNDQQLFDFSIFAKKASSSSTLLVVLQKYYFT